MWYNSLGYRPDLCIKGFQHPCFSFTARQFCFSPFIVMTAALLMSFYAHISIITHTHTELQGSLALPIKNRNIFTTTFSLGINRKASQHEYSSSSIKVNPISTKLKTYDGNSRTLSFFWTVWYVDTKSKIGQN